MATTVAYKNFSYHFHSETLLGKVIRLPLRLMPKGIPIRILSGIGRGMIWLTGAHVHGCWLGSYEKDKQDLCSKLIKENMTVFDVGANAGFYTLIFSRLVGHRGRVVAFEPDSENMCLLRKHVVLNNLENVSIVQAAASDTSVLTGFSLIGGATARLEYGSNYLVPTYKLDDLLSCGILPLPNVVKMDIEGAEVFVLPGAKHFIEKKTCIWIIALHGEESKKICLSIFMEAGYILRDLKGNDIDIINFDSDEFIAIPK